MKSAALLTEALPDTLPDDAGDFEVVFTYLVPIVILLQATEVSDTAFHLAGWRSP